MKRRLKIVLFLLSVFAFGPTITFAKAPIISRITIRGTDIFDFETKPNLRRIPYTWVNALHIETQEHVIRTELLFKEGDPVDPFLFRETERNLRALSFIRAARIVQFPLRDGTVAVVVHVNDAWTLEPQLNLSGKSNVEKYELGFKEKNFLGLGKQVSYLYTMEDGKTQNQFAYDDPQLLGTRWQMSGDYIQGSDLDKEGVIIQRPFFAADTKWSMRGGYSHKNENIEQFADNVSVTEYMQKEEKFDFGGGVKVGPGRKFVNHIGTHYEETRQKYKFNENSTSSVPLPENNTFKTWFLDFDSTQNQFIEITQIEKMTRVEDINLGGNFKISPGFSPHSFTGDKNATVLQSSLDKYTRINRANLFYLVAKYSSRNTLENAENERYLLQLKHYYRGFPGQTFVSQMRGEWGRQIDDTDPVKLGSDNGLRAYDFVAFRGDKSFLLNLEDRMFFIDDLWDFFSLGGVAFFDSGYAWEQSDPIRLSDLHSDIGLGLRLGLTKAANEQIVRIDFAYRMQSTPTEKTQWVIAFGSGQAF